MLPFFEPEQAPSTDPRDWYKYIFAEDPSIAFIGFAAHFQIHFGSGRNTVTLRRVDILRKTHIAAGGRTRAHNASGRRLLKSPLPVHVAPSAWFGRSLPLQQSTRRADRLPAPVLHLLLTSPRKWWWAVSTPWNSCQFWLNDPAHHDRIFETFARYRDNQTSEVYMLLILAPVLPLIGLCTRLRVFFKEHVAGGRWRRQIAPAPAPARIVGGKAPERVM